MKWAEWLENWSMRSLKVKASFLEMNFEPKDPDKDAAWELYIELITRIATQPLPSNAGSEKAALKSVHKIFEITRRAIKKHGRLCSEFTKIAVLILNQKIRPFTSKWHPIMEGELTDVQTTEFRNELAQLQAVLQNYTKMLADMADVEDLTELEDA